MNERQFINTIQTQNLGIITLSHASRILNKTRKYSSIYLQRLEQRKIITRIEKGKYALVDTPVEVIASNLIIPSYISFLSALSHYHLTTQIPRVLQLVAPKSKKKILYENKEIHFIKQQKIFGYKREKTTRGYLFIGLKEKIIIDCLYLPQYCPISETIFAMQESRLNKNKLLEYAQAMNSIVTIKRLGYLLEQQGIDIYPQMHSYLNKRFDLLNPHLPSKATYNSKWKLIINEVV